MRYKAKGIKISTRSVPLLVLPCVEHCVHRDPAYSFALHNRTNKSSLSMACFGCWTRKKKNRRSKYWGKKTKNMTYENRGRMLNLQKSQNGTCLSNTTYQDENDIGAEKQRTLLRSIARRISLFFFPHGTYRRWRKTRNKGITTNNQTNTNKEEAHSHWTTTSGFKRPNTKIWRYLFFIMKANLTNFHSSSFSESKRDVNTWYLKNVKLIGEAYLRFEAHV